MKWFKTVFLPSLEERYNQRNGKMWLTVKQTNVCKDYMKPAGYWPCRNEIINAHLSTPHKYEPFTELFDTKKLDEIRDRYGADLYKECYADALREVMELNEHYTGKQRREAVR